MAAATKRGTAIAECYCDGERVVLDVKEKGKIASQGQKEILVAQEEDVALILSTSGTTGKPRAVRRETLFALFFAVNQGLIEHYRCLLLTVIWSHRSVGTLSFFRGE